MTREFFFGYGSLVNARTHAYPAPRPATLTGWRRVWRSTPLRAEAFLSAEPGDGAIRGLVAEVPRRDWAALDAREAGYDRHEVTGAVAHDLVGAAAIRVYSVPPRNHLPAGDCPVLLSYLDVVIQGFLHRFGRAGADHFFATTDGWPASVRDDRAAPRYPRHQVLTDDERACVDAGLAALSVTVEKLD